MPAMGLVMAVQAWRCDRGAGAAFLVDAGPADDDPPRHARMTPVGKIVRRAEHLALLDSPVRLLGAGLRRMPGGASWNRRGDVYRSERERAPRLCERPPGSPGRKR